MIQDCNLLVVGGAVVERSIDGAWATKVPIADYLHELAEHFNGCTWMAELYEGPPLLTGRLNPELVRLVPFRGRLNAPVNWLRLMACLRQRPYVILYLPAILTLVPAIPIVKRLSQRMAVYLGNDYEKSLRKIDGKWPGWSMLYRFGHEYPMKLADVVIARGRYLAHLVSRLNENVIETVPLGHMNLQSRFRQPAHQNHNIWRVLYLGKVLWSKGLGDLFIALQLVVQKYPETPIVLDVVGDGADRREIEAKARNLVLERYIRFHGWIEAKDELSEFFSGADVLVVPTSSYPEGVPRVIDEALIQGVPVVATRVGGIAQEFADDQLMLVEPNAPEQLARAIEAILFYPKVRDRYLAGAQRRSALWARYGSAAQQHADVLLGNVAATSSHPVQYISVNPTSEA